MCRNNLSSGNCNLDLNASLDVDDDLLHNFGRGVQTVVPLALNPFVRTFGRKGNLLNQTLMNSHLKHIPSLRSFTTGCFTGSNLKNLGREADRAFNTQILNLSPFNEFGAHFLKRFDFARGKSDADFVDFL